MVKVKDQGQLVKVKVLMLISRGYNLMTGGKGKLMPSKLSMT